ncbi:dual specificity protein phosphatase 22 [Hydra vulgaris]|uniref:Dual specificity protein phosphatase 22 n=1 Tax=Hydra vulgaris TaxID=6087 RepID=A0ABM4DKA9_HYDVU
MGNGMNKVLPGLFIGSLEDSQDENQIKSNNITHILSLLDEPPELKPFLQNLKCKSIIIQNLPGQNMMQYFHECIAFIHRGRLSEGNVLVHCDTGSSRASTVCIAYIMTIADVDPRSALRYLKAMRNIVRPNHGFRIQLVLYHRMEILEVRDALIEVFGDINPADGMEVKKVLAGLS